jgi:hypothetical protein
MKTILVPVSCVDKNADDLPDYFYAEIGSTLIEKILLMARHASDYDYYTVSEWDYTGAWLKRHYDFDLNQIGDAELINTVRASMEDSFRMDCNLLEVTKNAFWWQGVPKHCGDELLMFTGRTPLSFLRSSSPAYVGIRQVNWVATHTKLPDGSLSDSPVPWAFQAAKVPATAKRIDCLGKDSTDRVFPATFISGYGFIERDTHTLFRKEVVVWA